MRKLLLIIFLLFPACAYPPDDSDFYNKICDWQDREISCQKNPNIIYHSDQSSDWHFLWLQYSLIWINSNVFYISEPIDYWPTSCEIKYSKFDDCDGMAILLWSMIRENRLPDSCNKLIILQRIDSNIYHMGCIVRLDNIEYIVNPSWQPSKQIYKYDEFFEVFPYYELILEFNLYSIWELPS